MILETIQKTNDIKKVDPRDYPLLAAEIRRFLIQKVSKTGGHLASNLGAVELTMALHIVFNLPEDKLIFDVGHQCYTHKLLSGRKEGFDQLRQYGGMSGFPKKEESDCDVFDTGHSSTSISTGLGLAEARDLLGEKYSVVSIIGDGSMTGGMAFEALNNASRLKSNFIIILNDNGKSIGDNVGGMPALFQNFRTDPGYNRIKENVKTSLDKIPNLGEQMVRGIGRAKDAVKQIFLPNMLFENMGLTYLGPIDGHNVSALVRVLHDARRVNRAVVVHVVTKKGKGYRYAEEDPERFHGIAPFNIRSGKNIQTRKKKTYTEYVSETMLELGKADPKVVAITAAMADGTGLAAFRDNWPGRFFDVGIAEQHAVGFAAGLAKGGLKPYVCIYSTFLQRAYDQLVHDVALQDLPVRILIDRAGLVGADGPTHHGMLDSGYLQTIPNLTILSPRDGQELREMLLYSLSFTHPLVIRYPRGAAPDSLTQERTPLSFGKAEVLKKGRGVLLFAAGSMVRTALETASLLENSGCTPTVVNARFSKPFDRALLRELADDHQLIAVLEEGNRSGGLGEHIADFSEEESLPWHLINLAPKDAFYPQGKTEELLEVIGLTAPRIAERIQECIKELP